MSKKIIKNQELNIPKGVSVYVDEKTNARTIALPFRLPDNTPAVLMVMRIKGEEWVPDKVIKSITLNYI